MIHNLNNCQVFINDESPHLEIRDKEDNSKVNLRVRYHKDSDTMESSFIITIWDILSDNYPKEWHFISLTEDDYSLMLDEIKDLCKKEEGGNKYFLQDASEGKDLQAGRVYINSRNISLSQKLITVSNIKNSVLKITISCGSGNSARKYYSSLGEEKDYTFLLSNADRDQVLEHLESLKSVNTIKNNLELFNNILKDFGI